MGYVPSVDLRRTQHDPPEAHLPVRAQRPRLAPDANRSNHRIDELDAQRAWQHHTDAGQLKGRCLHKYGACPHENSEAKRLDYGDSLLNARNSAEPNLLSYSVPNGLSAFAR